MGPWRLQFRQLCSQNFTETHGRRAEGNKGYPGTCMSAQSANFGR